VNAALQLQNWGGRFVDGRKFFSWRMGGFAAADAAPCISKMEHLIWDVKIENLLSTHVLILKLLMNDR
jgi:hypothetical protein